MPSDAPDPGSPESAPEGDPTSGSEKSGSHTWSGGKADPSKRIVAVVIDAVIAVIIGMIPWIGGIISAAYWLLRDGMELEFMDQRSVGKKLMKLRPITADGGRLDMMISVKRNWMFGFGGVIQFLVYIPLLGWLLVFPVALVALGIGVIELYKVLTDEEGRRFGDIWADTKVVEVDA